MSMTPFPPLDRTSSTFKDDVDALFGVRIPNFVTEANAMEANMSSVAAGGAYALPFKFSGNIGYIGSGGHVVSPNNGFLYFDNNDTRGASTRNMLTNIFGSGSATKAYIRIVSISNPSKWAMWAATTNFGRTGDDSAGYVGVGFVASSTGPAFLEDEAVFVYIDRVGDKGDTGAAYTPTALHVQENQATGVGPSGNGTTSPSTRTLNAVLVNTISGASVASNQVTLPAGSYDFEGYAPTIVGPSTRLVLFNVTDGINVVVGPSGYTNMYGQSSSNTLTTFSAVRGRFTISAAKSFTLRHYVGSPTSANAFGYPSNVAGQVEVYSDLIFRKVA